MIIYVDIDNTIYQYMPCHIYAMSIVSKELEIKGVGFKAILKGNCLDLDLGYSHQIEYQIPEGIQISVTENTKIKVEGTDKQLVGEVAAKIKRFYRKSNL